ncbi:alternative ribosome rescue aminoacyl-tRNA hydrolase ArfB [Pelagibacterium montanilacus]|uniref:alternative ribosome rescue aminoacyl-tRNA hydrolase ArfB n=1 Tax=Pelagibacterium montanilacus TaxID=2185280 RepID=UPI000F8E6FA5|nr:alternative ribosome rescue aminoacyl-tRNA hydrolase ArfB [Pelagibacterium montanilacus]
MRPIPVTDSLSIDEEELDFSFVRASGAGGQNVNKVATAAQLRFDLMGSPSLPEPVKRRAARIAGSRLTKDGIVVIFADSFRSQPQNRKDATDRLVDILSRAATPPKRRIATRPTLASKRRRIEAKARTGKIKKLRSGKPSITD